MPLKFSGEAEHKAYTTDGLARPCPPWGHKSQKAPKTTSSKATGQEKQQNSFIS